MRKKARQKVLILFVAALICIIIGYVLFKLATIAI